MFDYKKKSTILITLHKRAERFRIPIKGMTGTRPVIRFAYKAQILRVRRSLYKTVETSNSSSKSAAATSMNFENNLTPREP